MAEFERISARMLSESEQLEMAFKAFSRTWEIVLAEGVPAEIILAGLQEFIEQKSRCERVH
jgi:hypothetical protein